MSSTATSSHSATSQPATKKDISYIFPSAFAYEDYISQWKDFPELGPCPYYSPTAERKRKREGEEEEEEEVVVEEEEEEYDESDTSESEEEDDDDDEDDNDKGSGNGHCWDRDLNSDNNDNDNDNNGQSLSVGRATPTGDESYDSDSDDDKSKARKPDTGCTRTGLQTPPPTPKVTRITLLQTSPHVRAQAHTRADSCSPRRQTPTARARKVRCIDGCRFSSSPSPCGAEEEHQAEGFRSKPSTAEVEAKAGVLPLTPAEQSRIIFHCRVGSTSSSKANFNFNTSQQQRLIEEANPRSFKLSGIQSQADLYAKLAASFPGHVQGEMRKIARVSFRDWWCASSPDERSVPVQHAGFGRWSSCVDDGDDESATWTEFEGAVRSAMKYARLGERAIVVAEVEVEVEM
ncbi:hypothetical protein PVAG01_11311 [Phlyctema vagabunda]|uniref:Uncharacterized protein n=1 Tax=Phlyctema vagabunda TaxID=108571 RepID=A0ABR4P1Z2_9HELO